MVRAFTVRIYIDEERKNGARYPIISWQILIKHFRKYLKLSCEPNLSTFTAIVGIKKLHALRQDM